MMRGARSVSPRSRADTIEGLRTVIRGPSVASGAGTRVRSALRLASPPMMPWTRDRPVHVGPVVAVVGGGALLATSWAIVATTDHVSDLEARVFAAVNRLPGAAWPVVWVPMQLGSLA